MTFTKRRVTKSVSLLVGLGMIAALVACSSTSKTTPPPQTVSISATSGSPQSAAAGAAFANPLVVTVTTGGSPTSGAAVTFTAPSSGASGTFAGGGATATATTGSNGQATSPAFTANSTAGAYTVTASVSGATTPASFSLTNTAAATVAISATSGSPQSATVGAAFAAPLVATVTTNGSPTSGATVTFTAPASGASGTFAGGGATATATTGSNGQATSPAFTANSTAGAYSVTASVSGATTPASFSLTNTSPSLAAGNYVFWLSGTDKNTTSPQSSQYFYTGAFTVNSSGVITGGEQDFSDAFHFVSGNNNPQATPSAVIQSGTVTTTADGNLEIKLSFTEPYINNGAGTVTFDANMVSASKFLLTEYDGWATGSGEMDLQATGLTTPTGGFAFYSSGGDKFFPPLSMGGVINVDGTPSAGVATISGTGSVLDINDSCASGAPPVSSCAAAVYADQSLASGTSTITGPDNLGYVYFELNANCSGGNNSDPVLCGTLGNGNYAAIVLEGFMVDASHIRLIENWHNDLLTAYTGGTALLQTGAGSFTASSITGPYVVSLAGADSNGKLQAAGALTFNSGSVGGNLSINDIAVQSPQGGEAITGGTYAVDSTGRVTLTGVTDTSADFDYNLQLYLTGDGHALAISMDSTAATNPDVLGGLSWQQSSSTLNASSVSGNYSLDVTQFISGNEQDGVGAFKADGVSSLTGFLDLNEVFTGTTPTLAADSPLSDSFTATSTNGILTVTNNGGSTFNATAYLVDSTQGVIIENDNTQLTLGYYTNQ
jgi:hypothetical protein